MPRKATEEQTKTLDHIQWRKWAADHVRDDGLFDPEEAKGILADFDSLNKRMSRFFHDQLDGPEGDDDLNLSLAYLHDKLSDDLFDTREIFSRVAIEPKYRGY